jgi:hypothetical protein
MYTHIYVYIHIFMYTYICIFTYICVYIYVYSHTKNKILKIVVTQPALMTHTCNPNYSGGRDQKDCCSKSTPCKIVWETVPWKNPAQKRIRGVAQAVECLASKCEALSANLSTNKEKIVVTTFLCDWYPLESSGFSPLFYRINLIQVQKLSHIEEGSWTWNSLKTPSSHPHPHRSWKAYFLPLFIGQGRTFSWIQPWIRNWYGFLNFLLIYCTK